MKTEKSLTYVVLLCFSVVGFMYLANIDEQDDIHIFMKSWEEKSSSNDSFGFSSSHETISDIKEKCSPISNIMYVKTHKTGSTTIQSILYRYGFSRNLSFVFRRQNKKNGHIRYTAVTKDSPRKMFLPILGNGSCSFTGYNISAVHVVHNRPVMETFMNPGTKYITIIRNPASQLISAFLFFHIYKGIKGNSTEEKLFKFMNGTKWRRGHYGRNSQFYDLGLSKSHFDNDTKIKERIQQLSEQMDLVLISDYFEESLVLLKQELCWSFEDLAFTVQNNRSRQKPPISPSLLEKMRKFNKADFLLYEHFNRTLWDKIAKQGHAFWEDLRKFKQVQEEVRLRCPSSTSVQKLKQANESSTFCDQYAGGLTLFKTLFKRQTRVC
ncbi:Galactosylceramide sulfotransferase [Holothuria leucospilota]|uniref:Galactosylceramide sulfotransferase n=1 Tax=Holothuria leucospilota TaxID=206669 RepID=A0A9Q1C4Q1_HOLLE|nr:Galactosylceramide sulfotransferase [Holothuria leucospilota]